MGITASLTIASVFFARLLSGYSGSPLIHCVQLLHEPMLSRSVPTLTILPIDHDLRPPMVSSDRLVDLSALQSNCVTYGEIYIVIAMSWMHVDENKRNLFRTRILFSRKIS
jgi:hypothetical protein